MITFPELDPRDEDQVVAETIDTLPPEHSDRSPAAPEVKLIEGLGAMYAAILFFLNQWTDRLQLAVLNLLGIQPRQAQAATVTLIFIKDTPVGDLTIPQGTLVKDGLGVNAKTFITDSVLLIGDTIPSGTIGATAQDPGSDGNVVPDSLTLLDQPITGIQQVTNTLSASGGIDEEPIAALVLRAPLLQRARERAITEEDFVFFAESEVDGVHRAKALGAGGNVGVFILDSDLNEAPSIPLQTATRTLLLSKTTPGVGITVVQHSIRIIRFPIIQLKLLAGVNVADVKPRIILALDQLITARNQYATDGQTVEFPGWEWGESLFLHEVVSRLDQIEGVDRVGNITFSTSDDYGAVWTGDLTLSEALPGREGFDDTLFGLLHFDANQTLNITLL